MAMLSNDRIGTRHDSGLRGLAARRLNLGIGRRAERADRNTLTLVPRPPADPARETESDAAARSGSARRSAVETVRSTRAGRQTGTEADRPMDAEVRSGRRAAGAIGAVAGRRPLAGTASRSTRPDAVDLAESEGIRPASVPSRRPATATSTTTGTGFAAAEVEALQLVGAAARQSAAPLAPRRTVAELFEDDDLFPAEDHGRPDIPSARQRVVLSPRPRALAGLRPAALPGADQPAIPAQPASPGVRPARRVPPGRHRALRRPAGLVAAPRRSRPVDCVDRRRTGAIGWLVVVGVVAFVMVLAMGWLG